MTQSVTPPYPFFADTAGIPLENGYIYVGTVNLEPIGNPQTVYWDEDLTITAEQPIRTINGYPSRNGSPAMFYTSGDYSILVRDKKGSQVYSELSMPYKFSADLVSYTTEGDEVRTVAEKMRESVSAADFGNSGGNTIQNLAGIIPTTDGVYYDCVSFYNGYAATNRGPQGGGLFVWNASKAKSTHNGITVISPTVPGVGSQSLSAFLAGTGETASGTNGVWVRVNTIDIDTTMAGAKIDGSTDDNAAITAALNLVAANGGGTVTIPAGTSNSSAAVVVPDNCVLQGQGRESSIINFTGATDGIVVSANYAQYRLADLQIRTSNASGGKAINISNKTLGASNDEIESVNITASGSGRWAYGLWGTNFQTSRIQSLKVYQSATVGIRVEYACNAVNWHGVEVVGSSGAGTIQRAIEIDTTSGTGGSTLFEANFYGVTFQGYFTKSLVYSTGCNPKFFGAHFENTNASPTDGADFVLNGTSVNCSLSGVQGGSILTSGTVRNFSIAQSEVQAITIGASTAANLFNVRYTSLTQTAGCIVNLLGGDISGTVQKNFMQNTLLYYSAFPTMISDNSATPTLPGLQDLVMFNNSSATNVTSIAGGKTGQRLTVMFGNANTTLVDGTNLRMAGNLTGAINTTISFIHDGTNWFETCRSVN